MQNAHLILVVVEMEKFVLNLFYLRKKRHDSNWARLVLLGFLSTFFSA